MTAVKYSIANKLSLIILCLLIGACSGTRHLPPGEKLYRGAKIEIESSSEVSARKKRFIKSTAKDALRPTPNKSYLGIRPRLWIYMSAAENPKTKFGKWIKRMGEPPVLVSSVKPMVTSSIIDAKLFNIGVFKGYSDYKLVEKKNTAKIVYTCYIHMPYKINELTYEIADDSIGKIILSELKKSLIKKGQDYNLEILKAERVRIDDLLKNRGYFYFNPDYLIFKTDTSSKDLSVSFSLQLKDSIPKNALTVYRINDVFINQNYTLRDGRRGAQEDTTLFKDYIFKGKEAEMNIRPSVILRSIYFRKNEVYSRQKHNMTLNRLMSMGTFKFVQIGRAHV